MVLIIVIIMILCMLPIYESFLYNSNNKMMIRLNMMNNAEVSSLFTPTDDDDIDNVNTFKSIATSYLFNKFRDCQGDSCRDLCDKNEVADLVRGILNAHILLLLLLLLLLLSPLLSPLLLIILLLLILLLLSPLLPLLLYQY